MLDDILLQDLEQQPSLFERCLLPDLRMHAQCQIACVHKP